MNFLPLPPNGRVAGASIVLAGVIASVIGWSVLRLAGVELEAEQNGDLRSVGIAQVIFASLAGGVAAWAVYSAMSRWPSSLRYWPFVGSTALAISMLGPSYMADGASAAGLIVLHFLVAIPLIVGFAGLGVRECVDDERRSRIGEPSHHAG